MNLIEQLGLEKCKQIVERHRNLGTHFTKFKYYSVKKDDFFLSQLFIDFICVDDLSTAIACHATLTNKDSTYKAQTIDTIYLCTIVDGLILNDSCVITVTFTGSTSVVLIGSSKQMVINRVGDVINLLFNNESYSLKKDQIEAALRPYLGSRTLIQAFG